MGMSAQSYVVWLRIYEACSALAEGASLSGAAAHAGFADTAHFTRTFRRTFGLAPSQIAHALRLTAVRHGSGYVLWSGQARERREPSRE
jgi:AraC-like DNA-binding protein